MERAVILEGARTAIGKFLGSFADVPAVDLGVAVATETMRRANGPISSVTSNKTETHRFYLAQR